MVEKVQKNSLLQAWLVLTLALFFGTALAAVQTVLGPVIEENKIQETMEKVPSVLIGESEAAKLSESGKSLAVKPFRIAVEKNGLTKYYNVYDAGYENGKRAGWVVKSAGQGYADKVELLVGFDPAVKTITGLFILDQKETPGLGNKIVEDAWRSQFSGKSLDTPLAVVKGGAKAPQEIDAVSGATISSKSVTALINKAVADVGDELTRLNNQPKETEKGKE